MQEIITKCYSENSNYKIHKNNTKNGKCYIYCTSNALYIKNDPADFEKKVIAEDRYEWQKIRAKDPPELEIFIRDVWLSWYVNGINSEINSYERLIEFLKGVTRGYDVTCVGASSGGFIANIIAMELKNSRSYCFAAQFSLKNHFDHLWCNPYLNRYLIERGDYYFEYYRRLQSTNARIIYVCPRLSSQDEQQYKLVKDISTVSTISVFSKRHGIAIFPTALPKFLSFEVDRCMALAGKNKIYNMADISIRVGGAWSVVRYLFYGLKKVIRKILKND